jgi:spore coat protein U-like protein
MRVEPFVLVLGLAAASPVAAQVTTCVGGGISYSLGLYESYQSTHLDSSANVAVNCTRRGGPGNATVTISLGPSATSGSIATRRLRGAVGGDLLDYNFYRDAGRTQVWGDTPGVNTVAQTQHIANNATLAFSFTIFGRINALQDVRPGNYSDTLLLTIDF